VLRRGLSLPKLSVVPVKLPPWRSGRPARGAWTSVASGPSTARPGRRSCGWSSPAQTVLVFRAGSFDDGLEIGPGEQLTTPLLPGLSIAIDDLFAE
jgi:hypothetical protein